MGQTRLETQAFMLAAPATWTEVGRTRMPDPQTSGSDYFIV